MDLDDLYQDLLLDHFKNPRCHGCPNNSDAETELLNPLCGDKITLGVSSDGKTLVDIGFEGRGCSISQASASLMSELCKGKPITEVKHLAQMFRKLMRGEISEQEAAELNDALALAGVKNFAPRIKCAVLGWEALERCLDELAADEA